MKKKLIIIGAGGHGRVVADIAIKMNRWQSIAFLDDESINSFCGIEVIGKTIDVFKYKDDADFFVAIGNNLIRERFLRKFEEEGLSIATLIHPSAIIGTDVRIGRGTAVMAGVVINNSTIIGKGSIINTSSSLDHDNVIDEFVHISPGVRTAGSVNIGKSTWLGIGSVVSNNVIICGESIIGAGSVVINDISVPGTYVGVPARRINT